MEHNAYEPPAEVERPFKEPPKIYVASLADYANGHLHGVWIDATEEVSSMRTRIADMLDYSHEPVAEDFAVHDYEGFGLARINEHDSLAHIRTLAVGIAKHGEAFAAWMDLAEGDEGAADEFGEAYLGEFISLASFAETVIKDLGFPDPEQDAEALGQDMWLSGEVVIAHKPNGGVWLFRGNF